MCTILGELKDLVNQIGDSSCCAPCCPSPDCCGCAPCCYPPMTRPFAQCIMTCPPPILAPTRPQPVKPLQLPCPCVDNSMTAEEAERSRFDNYYNNYNIDWHADSACQRKSRRPAMPQMKRAGATVDGKPVCCEDYTKKGDCGPLPGCPTGFKPCTMRLTPPPCCNPNGVWCAEIQACPPKRKKASNVYVPGPCRRPCCKHWKPKEPPCLYDDPCKAHCYNHPVGIKPSGRFP